jgi:uncharacterized LabA/DUF88 family protein
MFTDQRNMIFVDGENFTIQGQRLAKARGVKLENGPWWEENVFLWMPDAQGDMGWCGSTLQRGAGALGRTPVQRAGRAYFFTSVTSGNTRRLQRIRLALRELHFDPEVFTKKRGDVTKGVDVSLTTSLVSHAYLDDYDVAFLLCGDGDYVPVVDAVRRAGKRVVVAFYGEKYGLSPDLRIAADQYVNLEGALLRAWRGLYERREKKAALEARSAALQEKAAAEQFLKQ